MANSLAIITRVLSIPLGGFSFSSSYLCIRGLYISLAYTSSTAIEYSPCNRPTDHSANSSPLSPLLVPTRWKFTSVLLTNFFAHAFPQERDDEYRRVFASLCPSERLLQAPKSEPRFEDQGTTPSAAWSYCTSLTPPGPPPTHRLAPLSHMRNSRLP
jgi:hypothetical protein